MKKHTPITIEAHKIVNGPRRKSYGPPLLSMQRAATMWSVVFGIPVTPEHVALAMVCLKITRQIHSSSRDNLVDIAGYAELIEMLNIPTKTT
jgi:hypothetical protein